MAKKAIVYIDGFNLYFSLKNNDWKKYYWLNIVKLSSDLIRPGHYLSMVKYFTSRIKNPENKKRRQSLYLDALYTLDFLKIKYGRYQANTLICRDCGREIPVPKEKKTDVNIATEMIMDAIQNKCDIQYLLSGDSDLAPPIEMIKKVNPKRQIYLICPPKKVVIQNDDEDPPEPTGFEDQSNFRISGELIRLCNGHQYIKENHLSNSQLPSTITNNKGKIINKPSYWCV